MTTFWSWIAYAGFHGFINFWLPVYVKTPVILADFNCLNVGSGRCERFNGTSQKPLVGCDPQFLLDYAHYHRKTLPRVCFLEQTEPVNQFCYDVDAYICLTEELESLASYFITSRCLSSQPDQ